MVAETCVLQLKDMVRTLGTKAGSWLVAGVGTGLDEDAQALNAYLLVDFLSTLNPIPLEVSKSMLKSLYDLAEVQVARWQLPGRFTIWERKNLGNVWFMGIFF